MSKFAGLAMQVEQPQRMPILHPVTRQPIRGKRLVDGAEETVEAYIDLLPAAGKVGKQHDRSVTDRQIKARGARYTAEMAEADLIEKVAILTRGWLLFTLDGEPIDVPFSTANARELYSMPETAWIRDQAIEFASDLGNYPAASSTS